ncbi:MAG: hypothetical protein QM756_46370 [Polyangiaceae bacterium]
MSFKKVLAILLGLFLLVGLTGVLVVAVFLPRYVRRTVIEEAERRGIALEPGDIGFGWGWAQIKGSKASLIGVPEVRATVSVIDVELKGFVPQRFTVNGLAIQVVGEAAKLQGDSQPGRARTSNSSASRCSSSR